MNLDGIIFDIDGTIWDVRSLVAEAWGDAIRENTKLPVVFDAARLGQLFGKPMDEIFRILYPEVLPEEMQALIPVLYEYEHRYIYERKPSPYEGVTETVSKLAEKYPLYIVTNAQKGYVEAMLAATGMGDAFQGWLCYGDTYTEKDATIRTLMKQYGLKQVVYIGDTRGDEEACLAAGVPFIYAAYGLGQAKQPEAVIDDITQLPELLVRYSQ